MELRTQLNRYDMLNLVGFTAFVCSNFLAHTHQNLVIYFRFSSNTFEREINKQGNDNDDRLSICGH